MFQGGCTEPEHGKRLEHGPSLEHEHGKRSFFGDVPIIVEIEEAALLALSL